MRNNDSPWRVLGLFTWIISELIGTTGVVGGVFYYLYDQGFIQAWGVVLAVLAAFVVAMVRIYRGALKWFSDENAQLKPKAGTLEKTDEK